MDTLSFQDFNKLPIIEKIDRLERYGTYMELKRIIGKYEVALFNYAGLYIEVYLHRKTDSIDSVEAILSEKQLYPYLNKVDISGIYSLI